MCNKAYKVIFTNVFDRFQCRQNGNYHREDIKINNK